MTKTDAVEPETFASTVFIVDGKTVDANGKEVKAAKADTEEADTDAPAPKPAAKK